MRMPTLDRTKQAGVNIEQVKAMADRFVEKGFTYFDTAQTPGDGICAVNL